MSLDVNSTRVGDFNHPTLVSCANSTTFPGAVTNAFAPAVFTYTIPYGENGDSVRFTLTEIIVALSLKYPERFV